MAGQILVGKRETVIAPWRERTTRNWDNKWDPRLTALVDSPPRPEGPDYERADAIVSFFQPYRWRREIGLLLVLGCAAAALRAAWRPALLVPAAAGLIVLASAALDGLVWRYRYPVDPLLAVTGAGGVQALWLASLALVRRAARFPAGATGLARGGSGERTRRGVEATERRAAEPAPLVERGT
jgi:hypothetical protein